MDTIKKKLINRLILETLNEIEELKKDEFASIFGSDYIEGSLKSKAIEVSKKILKAENTFLDNIYYIYNTNEEYIISLLNLFDSIFETIEQIQNFKDSGININQYERQVESIKRQMKELNKFTTSQIKPDNIPSHPSDIMSDFVQNILQTSFSLSEKQICNSWDGIKVQPNDKQAIIILYLIEIIEENSKIKNKQRLPKETNFSKKQKEKLNYCIELFSKAMNRTNKLTEEEKHFINNDKLFTEIFQFAIKA